MKEIRLDSPLNGQLIELKDVKDPAFASGAMGKGAAVKNPDGKVYSPVDGEVTVLFDTKHAIGIHADNGADILIHVGIDTVQLGGKFFDAKIAQGDRSSAASCCWSSIRKASRAPATIDDTGPRDECL